MRDARSIVAMSWRRRVADHRRRCRACGVPRVAGMRTSSGHDLRVRDAVSVVSGAMIMVVRQGEMPAEIDRAGGIDLTGQPDLDSPAKKGWTRATCLVTLFSPTEDGVTNGSARLPRPAVIYGVGTVRFAVAGLVVAVLGADTSILGVPGAGLPEPVVSVLRFSTLLGICTVAYLSAPSTVRPDTRDPSLSEVGWAVALSLYLLRYAVAFSAMFSSLDLGDSLFAGGGNLFSAVQYAIAVLGFALASILRSRTPVSYAALAGVTAIVVCLPFAVGAPLIAAATAHPATRPVIDLGLLVVLIPALLWLARHRIATGLLCPAATAAVTNEPIDRGDAHEH